MGGRKDVVFESCERRESALSGGGAMDVDVVLID